MANRRSITPAARVPLAGVLIAGLTAIAFAPVLSNGFVNYDDPMYVTQNPYLRIGFTPAGFRWAATATYAANWHPLTWVSHLADYALFGLHPSGHHLVSLLLHTGSAVLLLGVLDRATRAPWRSAVVAALFALHPLRVESVAWAAERKDVLSTFCLVVALATYVRYAERPTAGRYGWVFVACVLGLLAKPMLVTVPAILLLVDFWPLRRTPFLGGGPGRPASIRMLVLEKLPLLLVAIAVAAVTVHAQARGGALAPLDRVPLGTRALNACTAYVRYVWMTLYPRGLAPFYPYGPRVSPIHAAAAIAVLALVSVLAAREATRRPYLLVGWGWYVLTLVPVIGIVQVGEQAYADRYTYIPHIGLLVMIVWLVADGVARVRLPRPVVAAATVTVILACAALTHAQTRRWSSSVTLFEHTLRATGDNYVAYLNLGAALAEEGRLDDAIRSYGNAIRVKPASAEARNDLGNALEKKGDLAGAERRFGEALALAGGGYAEAHYNLGRLLRARGDVREAEAHYREALRLRPTYVEAHNNLGQLLLTRGDTRAALAELRAAVALRPDFADAHNNLGIALRRSGDLAGALREYRTASELDPRSAEAFNNLGNVLTQLGRFPEAEAAYRRSVAVRPQYADAYLNWGDALGKQGRFAEAAQRFADALGLDPANAEAREKYERARALAGRMPS